MFPLATVEKDLRSFCRALRPDDLTPPDAAARIEELARIERLAAGARLRLVRRVDETVTGDDGERAKTDWLAKVTGQSPTDAAKDLDTSNALDELSDTDQALRDGELSPAQAREVAAAASQDPSAEEDLLNTARNASVPELRRHAKKVRSAAMDDQAKDEAARRNRDLGDGRAGDLDPAEAS